MTQAGESYLVSGLQLPGQFLVNPLKLSHIARREILAVGVLGQFFEGGLIDAVVVKLDGEVLKNLVESLAIAGMMVGAAGLLGHLAHDSFVQFTRPAEAEHVKRDFRFARGRNDLLDAPAARLIILAVGKHDHGALPVRAGAGGKSLDGFVGGVEECRLATGAQITDAVLQQTFVRGERLGRLGFIAEGQEGRAGAGSHDVHEAAGSLTERLDLAHLVGIVRRLVHADAAVENQHAGDRGVFARLADADGVDGNAGDVGVTDDILHAAAAVQIDAVGQEQHRAPPFQVAEHADRLGRRVQVSRAAAWFGGVDASAQAIVVGRGQFLDAESMVKKDKAAFTGLLELIEKAPGGLLGFLDLAVIRHAAADVDGEDGRQRIEIGRQNVRAQHAPAVFLDNKFILLDIEGRQAVPRDTELRGHKQGRFAVLHAPNNVDAILRLAVFFDLLLLDAISRRVILSQSRKGREE